MKTKINLKEFKGSVIAAVTICVVLLVLSMALGSSREKTTQKKTEVTVELGSTTQLHFDATDFFDVDIQKARKFSFDTSKVDLTKVGEYEVNATYRKEAFVIAVKVVDTTKPAVELMDRVVFTNDIEKANSGIAEILASVADASEYTAKLIRFEKKDVLSTMNEFALGKLKESIVDFRTKEEALTVGTEDIPTQPGIYRSVLEVADVHGNTTYKEVYVILDTTGAIINDVEDMTVTVAADKLNEKPALDTTLYKGYDEVDGTLTSDDLAIELTLKDEAKHEWTVAVSYTDRAGNESKSEFLITVAEEKKQTASNDNQKPSGNTNSGSNQGGTTNTPSGNGNTSSNNDGYDPRDLNKDGTVSGDEEAMYITPEKQACIDAGYGVVVEMNGGEWYAVLMKNGDHKIDGKDGFDILDEYLKERKLGAKDWSGCWINGANEWYWYSARDIYELPDDGFNLEDGEWEFVD